MALAGQLEIQLIADVARLQRDMTAMKGVVFSASSEMNRALGTLQSAFSTLGAGLSVAALVAFTKSTIDATARFKDLGQEAGTTASAISKFEAPARMAGLGLDAVSSAMFKMSKAALEAKDPASNAAKALNAIGISTGQLKGLKPDEMFELVARSVSKYGDGLEKNAVMQELFGKSGREMNKVIAEIASTSKLTATVTDEQAEAADRLQDQMVELKMNSEQYWRSLMSLGVPALNDIVKALVAATKEGGLLNGVIAALSETFTKMRGTELEQVNKQIEIATKAKERLSGRGAVMGLLTSKEEVELAESLNALLAKREQILKGIHADEIVAQNKRALEGLGGKAKIAFDPKGDADAKKEMDRRAKDLAESLKAEQAIMEEAQKFGNAFMLEEDKKTAAEREAIRKGMFDAMVKQEEAFAQVLREAGVATNDFYKKQGDLVADINEFLDPARAQSFGDALRDSFGSAGSALAAMSVALNDYGRKEAELAKQREKIAKIDNPETRAQLTIALNKKAAETQIASYAQIAGAAKGFFNEGTKGYKALEAAEKTFQAFQLASDLVKGVSAAAVAIANQAQGDPYTAWARMALMAAAMAAIGFAVGGVGGGGGAHEAGSVARQASQGTGTVFGDVEAKSESITNALEILRDNSSDELLYTSRMLATLINIESSMSGMAAAVARSQLNGAGRQLPGSQGGNTFSLDDAGIILGRMLTPNSSDPGQAYGGQTVTDLINNAMVTTFTDIARSHSGLRDYTAVNRDQASMDPGDQLVRNIGRTVRGIRDAIAEAVVILTDGATSIEDVNRMLADIHIDPLTISFAGLAGDELQEALGSVFSQLGDTMVMALLKPANLTALEAFQRVGEGAFETIIRVASGIEAAKAQLDLWGIEMIRWQDIVNTQGDVTVELIRESIIAAETVDGVTSSMGLLIESFDGSAEDLVGLYEKLLELGVLLRASALDTSLLSQALITAAGGIARLQSGLQAYSEGFFTKEERDAAARSEMVASFERLGLVLPATRAAFRAMVEAAEAAGNTTLVGQLLALAPAFRDLVPAVEGAVDSIVNAGAYITAETNRNIREWEVAQRQWEAGRAGRSKIADYLSGSLTGANSPLDPMEKFLASEQEYKRVLGLAQGGDPAAMMNLPGARETMIQLARSIWGSSSAFEQIFERSFNELAKIGEVADYNTRMLALQESSASSLTSVVALLERIANRGDAMTASAEPEAERR